MPGSVAPGPVGPFPAGVGPAIDHLVAAYGKARRPGRDQWVFLVGGPGNGKSEALKRLLAGLGLAARVPEKGAKAPRSIEEGLPGSGIAARMVNDASIAREDEQAGRSLTRDVDEAFAFLEAGEGCMLLANVNRGILVEECRLASGAAPSRGAEVLHWLNAAAAGSLADDPSRSYYHRKVFETAGRSVAVHAVSLDAVSLFEPQPGGEVSLDFAEGDDPVVASYEPVGGLKMGAGSRARSVAAKVVATVLEQFDPGGDQCDGCAAAGLCPFRANAIWLRDDALRENFLDLGRASEVAANRRMTYRDLLGHISLALLGPMEPDWIEGMHPCDWVVARAVEPERPHPSVVDLARHRIYTCVFPPPNAGAEAWKRRGPGAVAKGDPYLHIIADFGLSRRGERSAPFSPAMHRLDPSRSVDDWSGARALAVEAAEALHVEAPAASLVAQGLLPAAAVCGIEHRLDASLQDVLAGLAGKGTEVRRREAQVRRWRSVLLLRQVGLAQGEMAEGDAVEAWLRAQLGALVAGDLGDLLQGLQNLLLPSRTGLKLALYRARARALGEVVPPLTLLVVRRANELSVEVRPVKDSLQVLLRLNVQAGSAALPVPVDLDIAREALLLVLSPAAGFTDLPDRATARMERVRASLASPSRSTGTQLLHVSDRSGKLHVLKGRWGVSLALAPAGRR